MQTQTKIALIVGTILLFAVIYFFSASGGDRENVPVDTKQPAAAENTGQPSGSSARTPTGGSATPSQSSDRQRAATPTRTNQGARPGATTPNRTTPAETSTDRLAERPAPSESTQPPTTAGDGSRDSRLAMRGRTDDREAGVDPDADTTPGTTPPTAEPATTPLATSAQPTVTERTAMTTPDPTQRPVQPPVQTPATPAPKARKHVVVEGDTFSTLALQYYGSQRYTGRLIQANPQVSNPNMLKIGMELNVPDLGETITQQRSAESIGPNQYRVRSGDSFASIARDKLGDERRWPELYEINKERLAGGPDTIKPGTIIYLSEPSRRQQ